ncbi:MAG: hypothetical protein RRZ84_07770 [Romboutsia sp.]
MQYNNTKKCWETNDISTRGIIYIDAFYIELGYFNKSQLNIPIMFRGGIIYLDLLEHCSIPIYWCNNECCYSIDSANANNIIAVSKHIFNYPIEQCYNFSKLDLSPRKLKFEVDPEFKYISNFTFGIEYETCGGNIPWISCLETNLVPLYDGSISGHEYVTFPMTSCDLPIINKHLDLLKFYTEYDLNCSLHIHFGGFPIIYHKIERLCKAWYYFQSNLEHYIPAWSYYVEMYKNNGKAYNKPWNKLTTLSTFYKKYTCRTYTDDNCFNMPNAYDINEEKKWEVKGRYFNMNIMHLISGNSHKTVEFRFLRPTTNYYEIKWYILVFSAFLTYIIDTKNIKYNKCTVNKVIDHTFPKNIANKLKIEGRKLYHLHKVQTANKDFAGINDELKDIYLTKIHNFNM